MDIDRLSVDQLAGQRMMVGFDGAVFNGAVKSLIDEFLVGGIILFAQNVVSPEQLKELCTSVQQYAASIGHPPLLIAVDQEGGAVARLKEPFTRFPGNPAMEGTADAAEFAAVTARELLSVGINMNMAPVMDVPPEGFESVMDGRVFGKDPEWVARMGTAVINGLQHGGVMAVAKHFPGIGRTTLDSHLEMPLLDTPHAELEATDLIPFRAAVNCGVAGIMMSHIKYTAIDPEWPASLSPKIVMGLLRDKMGYDGLILTDDLDMGSIQKQYPVRESIRQIGAADVDIALICHAGPDIETACEEMRRFVGESDAAKERCRQSVKRVVNLRQSYLS